MLDASTGKPKFVQNENIENIEKRPTGRQIIFEKSPQEIRQKELVATTRKLNELDQYEKIRQELGLDNARPEVTEDLNQEKTRLQEKLININHSDLENNFTQKEWEQVGTNPNIVQLADLPEGRRKIMFDVDKLKEYANQKRNSENTNSASSSVEPLMASSEPEVQKVDMVEKKDDRMPILQEMQPIDNTKVEKIVPEKKEEFNEEQKILKEFIVITNTAWNTEHEYPNQSKVLDLAERLANIDPEFRKELSKAAYDQLSSEQSFFNQVYKGLNEDGRLITKGGEVHSYPYNIDSSLGPNGNRYRNKVLENFANRKGLI